MNKIRTNQVELDNNNSIDSTNNILGNLFTEQYKKNNRNFHTGTRLNKSELEKLLIIKKELKARTKAETLRILIDEYELANSKAKESIKRLE